MAAYYDAWTWILNDWLWVTPYNRLKLWNFVTVLVFGAWKVENLHEYSLAIVYNEQILNVSIYIYDWMLTALLTVNEKWTKIKTT